MTTILAGETRVRRRHMEVYLFDTCTHKCAYCWLAESGAVLDGSQLRPYRDPAFIARLTDFFARRTNARDKWVLSLTGGEPLLMPNFPLFVDRLAGDGNKVAIYTALLVGDNNAAFRYLLDRDPDPIDYLMVSFHPEAEQREDEHFKRLELLKSNGHSVIFRFVGHPQRLGCLDELAMKCRDRDIAFHPTPLFSPEYPSAYTAEEKATLERHTRSLSQLIQLENGLDTSTTRCDAGSALFSMYVRTGDITPCASVDRPVLGNLYEDRLDPLDAQTRCPKAGISCICDIHFQQATVAGADDTEAFDAEKRGYVPPADVAALRARLAMNGLRFSKATPGIGQTQTAAFQSLDTDFVKQAHYKNKAYFEQAHRDANNPVYRDLQFGGAHEAKAGGK